MQKCSSSSKGGEASASFALDSPDTGQNPKTTAPSQQRLTQMHLDLGQKNFHSVQCPKCGLVYTPGKEADERLHANFHRKSLKPAAHYQAAEGDILVASDGFDGEIVLIKECHSSKTVSLMALFAYENPCLAEIMIESNKTLLLLLIFRLPR